MEFNIIKRLVKRLAWLGYTAYEISAIVRDAVGDDGIDDDICVDKAALVISHLRRYERLGADYLLNYSK
ncbi:hypothetical protein [Anaeroselena agilis]|uniref:Uncharacterized protein n=1 Tax=Anaeroselena agilis TaxID=3063788 RepID=A0ABU3P0E6_9FIRM|nr:hypothetical protein [Selenomonadales bacterium 4137-cl]